MNANHYIFVLNGSGGVGKDTFVKLIDDICNVKIIHLSSIVFIKNIAQQLGWDGNKSEKDRKFLSDLKRLSNEYNEKPRNLIYNSVKTYLKDYSYYTMMIFVDIREPEEIALFKEVFPDSKTILMKNKNVPVIKSNNSDAGVFAYPYDIFIDNDGTLDDLVMIAREFASDVLLNGSMKHIYKPREENDNE